MKLKLILLFTLVFSASAYSGLLTTEYVSGDSHYQLESNCEKIANSAKQTILRSYEQLKSSKAADLKVLLKFYSSANAIRGVVTNIDGDTGNYTGECEIYGIEKLDIPAKDCSDVVEDMRIQQNNLARACEESKRKAKNAKASKQ